MTTPSAIVDVVENLSDNFSLQLNKEQGANGYIYFGKNLILNKDIVLKFYYWADEKRAHTEPQTMEAIDHENILKVSHAGFGTEDWAYFVSPFMRDGTIDALLDEGKYDLIQAVRIAAGIASGLCELHSRHILHRDLKAANIFMDDGRPVIGDFGSIIHINDLKGDVVSETRHSLIYRPPEACKYNKYSVRSDIYQVGLVLYQLCGGYLPYLESDWLSSGQKIKYQSLSEPEDQIFARECIESRIETGRIIDLKTVQPYTPKALQKIIKTCCETAPANRFETSSQLLIALTNMVSKINAWHCLGNQYVLNYKKGAYSIRTSAGKISVFKRKGYGVWMQQHRLGQFENVESAIVAVEKAL